jgi:haloalkane dehalogenase
MSAQQPWNVCKMMPTRHAITDAHGTQSTHDGDPQWLSREAFPFQSRFVMLQGQRVHYVDEGEGVALLFLHGNPTWSFLYRRMIQALASRYRCIALDYPGFGLSSASDAYELTPAAHASIVEAFVRELALPKFIIVAHDWGGPIGLSCALAMPERIDGLILFNTFAWSAQGDAHFERFSRLMGGGLGRMLVQHANLLIRLMTSNIFSHSRLSAVARRAYMGPFAVRRSRRAISVFAREILGSRDFLDRIARRLDTLSDRPVLILWPECDIAFKARHRARLQASFPAHTTVLLPRAGHFPQEDCPDTVIQIMQSWLQQRIDGSCADPQWKRHTTDLDSVSRASQ